MLNIPVITFVYGILAVVLFILFIIACSIFYIKFFSRPPTKKTDSGRYRAYYQLLFEWMLKRQEYHDFTDRLKTYFDDNEITTIAIYGMTELSELFYNEIQNIPLCTLYIIDENAEEFYTSFGSVQLIALDGIQAQKEVDAIIITHIYDFENISKKLENVSCMTKCISLIDIINAL